jgi:GTP pyrophosphokinase
VIGEEGANIDHIEFVDRTSDFRDIVLDLQVRDLKHLNMIIGNLKSQSVVSKVERVNG